MRKPTPRTAIWVTVTGIVACGVAAFLQLRRPPVAPVAEVSVDEARTFEELPEAIFSDDDWPGWRGPRRDGAEVSADPPTEWTPENILWKSDVPGRGHGSPIILSNRVYLPTAEESSQEQAVLAYDLNAGKQLWQTKVHDHGFDSRAHRKNTQASSTLATDGERLFAAFLSSGSIWLSALDLEGDLLWQIEIGGFASRFGYAASPIVYGSLVIVAADHDDGGFLSALHRETGDVVWRKRRPAAASYGTPTVINIGGRDQLLICGGRKIDSYDPVNGELIWSVEGAAQACVGSPVSDGGLVFASGGYPERETVAIQAESGDVVWRSETKSYVPSLLAHEGFVYQIQDDGILRCFQATDGNEAWKKRLGGKFSASPVLAGNAIFVCDEDGKVTVFEANGEEYRALAKNSLGDSIMATPAISGDRLVLRVAEGSGAERTEHLYCLARVNESDGPSTEAAD